MYNKNNVFHDSVGAKFENCPVWNMHLWVATLYPRYEKISMVVYYWNFDFLPQNVRI